MTYNCYNWFLFFFFKEKTSTNHTTLYSEKPLKGSHLSDKFPIGFSFVFPLLYTCMMFLLSAIGLFLSWFYSSVVEKGEESHVCVSQSLSWFFPCSGLLEVLKTKKRERRVRQRRKEPWRNRWTKLPLPAAQIKTARLRAQHLKRVR